MVCLRGICGNSFFYRRGHGLDKGLIGTKQNGLRQFVVLGLGEEIHRHPVGLARTIRDDQHLRRTGNHVDTDRAEHAALGRSHIGIAGSDDLVHLGTVWLP